MVNFKASAGAWNRLLPAAGCCGGELFFCCVGDTSSRGDSVDLNALRQAWEHLRDARGDAAEKKVVLKTLAAAVRAVQMSSLKGAKQFVSHN